MKVYLNFISKNLIFFHAVVSGKYFIDNGFISIVALQPETLYWLIACFNRAVIFLFNGSGHFCLGHLKKIK
jgi:hypothetical protein